MSERTRPSTAEEVSVFSRVLNTAELLESILLSLDMRSLLTSAPRVCRQWRNLIQGSIFLQRSLFFECEEKPAGSHAIKFNPLLVELFPLLFDFSGEPASRGFNDLDIEALPIGRRRVAFYRLNASWRRMHMRQPPVEHVALWTLDKIQGREEKIKMVRYGGGLRMEGFYFLVLKHVYWWGLFVKWGEVQTRQLCHLKYVRAHMVEPAEAMMRTADVTIGALADDYCVEEGNARKLGLSKYVRANIAEPVEEIMRGAVADDYCVEEMKARKTMDGSGLVNMGIFWFKVQHPEDWEIMWEKEDSRSCCWLHYSRGAERQYIWAHDFETNTDRRLAII